jgi:hypothetical protein
MMVSKATDPQIKAFLAKALYLSGLSVHRELVTVGLQLEMTVNDRSDPARRGGHSAKSIKMRLNDTATASGSAAADETRKHLIRSGRQSSKLGHGCHVLHGNGQCETT